MQKRKNRKARKAKIKKMAVTLVCNDHFMNRLLYFLVSRVCDTLLTILTLSPYKLRYWRHWLFSGPRDVR